MQNNKSFSFYIHTLGCKVNFCDSEKFAEEAEKIGWTRARNPLSADFCLINTCTVTSQADATARKIVRKINKKNPRAKIFVSGCYARTEAASLKKIAEINLVIESGSAKKIVSEIYNFFERNSHNKIHNYSPKISEFASNRTRAFIKIQDGCNRFCAYCKIPFARGRAESIPFNHIIDNLKKLAKKNYKEVVLTGINIAAYDFDGIKLADLLDKISKTEIISRVRLSSIEATAITKNLCKIFSESNVLMPHIHIPLQSGSDKVLKLMNRKIMADDVINAADIFLSSVKNAVVTTDIIVGLPGEEAEDFEKTLDIVRKIPFGKVHIFQYSPREGTAAAKMKKLFVQPAEIKRREKILMEVAEISAQNCRKKFADKILNVLIEQKSKNFWTGFSENYLRVKTTNKNLEQNNIVKLDMKNPENFFSNNY